MICICKRVYVCWRGGERECKTGRKILLRNGRKEKNTVSIKIVKKKLPMKLGRMKQEQGSLFIFRPLHDERNYSFAIQWHQCNDSWA